MGWLQRGKRSSPVLGLWAVESRRVMAAATHMWGVQCSWVMGPAPGAQAGTLQAPRDAPSRGCKSILTHAGDAADPPVPHKDNQAVTEQGVVVGHRRAGSGHVPVSAGGRGGIGQR